MAAAAALARIDPEALEQAQPSTKELASLWADLAGTDPMKAYHALWSFVLAPRRALPWLRTRLTPVTPPDPARLARLIADLDSEVFRVRQEAKRQLKELGELAEPDLRAVLTRKPSLEVRRRVEELLRLLDTGPPTPRRIRALRAVAVLERIDTSQARELLRSLAGGAAGASLTREAKAACERLSHRPARR